MTARKFRDEICAEGRVPRWLRGFVGLRFLYAIGLHLDLLVQLLVWGVKSRFPGINPSATPYLCRDRGVLRGPEETEVQICARLRKWRSTAKIKGGVYAVLTQLRAYLTPYNPRIRIVNNRGRYHELAADGTFSVGDQSWNWDGEDLPTRFWVLIWLPGMWTDEGTFGDDGEAGDGGTLGSTAAATLVAGVQNVIRAFSCENSRHMNTICIWDADAWDAQQPDGTWGRLSCRNPSACYWPGAGETQ